MFTYELEESVDLEAGWLSVQYQGSPVFYWLNTVAGAGFPAIQNTTILPERLAMCLSGGGSAIGDSLTLDYYEATTPGFGGTSKIPTHLDATGTLAGEVYTADIVFTSTPKAQPVTVGSFDALGDIFVNWNQMGAGALIAALPGIIFVFVAQKYLIAGLTSSAVKA